ncbi:MAG: hypothetical protein HY470_00495 [Candidatus Ryanbacteria bacterium]|nr:hypothetical protein [Candidatus Ryanbacteria bacterium]
MQEGALSMEFTEQAKKSLLRLEEVLPNAVDPWVYDFGKFLAENLRGPLTPSGFVFVCEQSLKHLERGECGYGRGAITHTLACQGNDVYLVIRQSLGFIFEHILPAEFAREVKRLWRVRHPR